MQLYLLLNNACNLKCSFCIRGHQDSEYIEVKALSDILKRNDFSHYHLLLTGGEPSLHPNLNEIIDLCQPFFKSISINTNGFNSLWIDNCQWNNIHVQISLDGTRDTHNKIRGNGIIDVYRNILCTIDKLNQRNIVYSISTTVGIDNYENVKELCHEIVNLPKMKYWKVSSQLPFGCADEQNTIDCAEWNDLVDYLLDNATVLLRIKKLFDFNLLDEYLQANPIVDKLPKTNCGNVKYKIYVYPDFTVYPCTCLTDFPIGNLLVSSLKDILTCESSKTFSDYQIKAVSACIHCKYVQICNGGCIGMSYHFFGKIGMGDYRCPLMKKD